MSTRIAAEEGKAQSMRTVQVTVEATVKAEPDTLSASLNIQRPAETPAAALAAARAPVSRMLERSKAAELMNGAAVTSATVVVVPRYGRDSNETPIGYSGRGVVTLEAPSASALTKAIDDIVADEQFVAVGNQSWQLTDSASYRREAIRKASANALLAAQAAIAGTGGALGFVVSLEARTYVEQGGTARSYQYNERVGGGDGASQMPRAAPLRPDKVAVKATVTAVYEVCQGLVCI